ncbi:FMN-binding protein [Micrococcaceae bacterium Sec5.7]
MRPSVRKSVFAGVAGLSLAGAVAGCAPSAGQSGAQSTPAGSAGAAASSSGTAAGSAGPSAYKDGTYSADGNYVSPNGTETVGVELTLSNGTVSDVTITEHPSNPNTRKFQGEFAAGVKAQIVGKSLDGLNVSKVAGSSLTSGGFNQAVEQIKSEAQ